ncbi:hypothetical protein EJB05_14126, partial [Eragrostis curvula]
MTLFRATFAVNGDDCHQRQKVGDKSIAPSTWQIRFHLDRVIEGGTYMLRIALAASHVSILKVQVNERAGEAGVEPRVRPDLPFSAGDAKPNQERGQRAFQVGRGGRRAPLFSLLPRCRAPPTPPRHRAPPPPPRRSAPPPPSPAPRAQLPPSPAHPCSTASIPGAASVACRRLPTARQQLLPRPRSPRANCSFPGIRPSRASASFPRIRQRRASFPSSAQHQLHTALRHLLLGSNIINVGERTVAMAPDQMFDLNFEPVDVDGDDADAAIDNLLDTPQGVGQQPEVAHPDEGHASSEDDNAKSAGMTVPTATTASGAVDVEEGVEVISTPNDPCVGMTFDTYEAAKSFYNNYARYKGFSVRTDNSKETKWAGGTSRVKYVCHKAGVNKKKKPAIDGPITEKEVTKKRKRDHIERTKCPSLMAVKFTRSYWVVDNFRAEHNHDLVQKFSLTKFLRSHRDIPPEEKQFIRTLHNCTIKTVRAYQLMCELYGGEQNVPYTVCDCKNLHKSYGVENEEKDMKKTFELFDEMKKQDPDFFYDYTLDKFGRVEHLLWIDGESTKQDQVGTTGSFVDTGISRTAIIIIIILLFIASIFVTDFLLTIAIVILVLILIFVSNAVTVAIRTMRTSILTAKRHIFNMYSTVASRSPTIFIRTVFLIRIISGLFISVFSITLIVVFQRFLIFILRHVSWIVPVLRPALTVEFSNPVTSIVRRRCRNQFLFPLIDLSSTNSNFLDKACCPLNCN